MPISADLFDAQFSRFKEVVRAASGRPFTSFHSGLAEQWESYKQPLREEALARLVRDKWRRTDICTGKILEKVLDAIEISDSAKTLASNLVRWENRYGHANRSHHALLDARSDKLACREFEEWFFVFFERELDEAAAFERFREMAGSRYDLIAYLFFLRDWDRFMPIATTTFDEAFELIGIDLVTRQNCTWGNYKQYNLALSEVQNALRSRAGIAGARLVDAHSFCWMLVRVERELLSPKPARPNSGRMQAGAVKFYDARNKSIWELAEEMAARVEQTVRNSNGQIVERVMKNKELRMSRLALEAHIEGLLERQDNKCALTGIRLQYRGEQLDKQLLPSLDRIDSDGHYEEGNLQIVCRFINGWKGDAKDEEFRRLLSLVRGDDA